MTADRVDEMRAEWAAAWPEMDTSPMAVIGRIHRLAAHLTGDLCPVYEAFGLTEGEFDVLATLRRAGAPFERCAGDLAASTMITSGGMSKRLDRLERAGLVRRLRVAGDGRERRVRLTAAGKRTIDRAFAAHMDNERRLLDVLSPSQAAHLARILQHWLTAYEQPPTRP